MKKNFESVLMKFGFLTVVSLLATITPVQGQSLAYGIRANIPFDFSVANTKLPSGKYSIGRASQNSLESVLSVANRENYSSAIRISIPVEAEVASTKTALVFHRYGDDYFLFQVWVEGESIGRQFSMSKNERDIQRRFATAPALSRGEHERTVETVTIVGGLL